MNYARFLNAVSKARVASPIRELTAIQQRGPPTLISLASGMPNTDMFPFTQASVTLPDDSQLHLDQKLIKRALQYSPSPGIPELVQWLKNLQVQLHNPPTCQLAPEQGQMDLCVTTGSQEALSKTFEMLVTPGDNVLMDQPTYPGTLAAVRPLGCNLLPVETDQLGMRPDALRDVLSRWKPEDCKNPQSDIPKVLYTIPNGGNPTGATMSLDRRQEIYEIARNYDLMILEDDPYYFLQFTRPRLPSFLSMDVDSRVLKFDSFSKILSSGMRVGYMTGPKPVISKIVLHIQSSTLHTSTLTQMILFLLLEKWGVDGFLQHCDRVSDFYQERRDHMIKSADRWLTGLAEWHPPSAGMFLWLKLLGIHDTHKLIMEKAMEKEVLFVPGNAFSVTPGEASPYVRAAFSQATPEQMDKGLERLARLLREERQLAES
ncbi:AADAT [Branchiostoma lanceolatum]|uniref:Kynurenine/alpha-aminoadipate aminotransferase, mitochondrial n=1 Tax=Branchiostoma lanceolatum TaxID=7740 RepID=A0A8K0EV34_BRALA|nr:AADAT [Branchiostoma lanceolatum]